MKRFVHLALLALPLALTPKVGFAKDSGQPLSVASDAPLSAGSSERHIKRRDIIIINEDFRALIRAERNDNTANIARDEAALEAAINDLVLGIPASPAV
jgi:hypothetical protein